MIHIFTNNIMIWLFSDGLMNISVYDFYPETLYSSRSGSR
ncbi:hypothetical protein KKH3_20450 [Pectobacterium actinidiae]|nr:hypothetical protein KKH3_20450 [Pectobacterium actinidiae]